MAHISMVFVSGRQDLPSDVRAYSLNNNNNNNNNNNIKIKSFIDNKANYKILFTINFT